MNQQKEEQAGNAGEISPYRAIPFDIGGPLSSDAASRIETSLEIYEEICLSDFIKGVSQDILFGFQLKEEISLFIYSYGVGVFLVKGETFRFSSDEDYAMDYCKARKAAHAGYLQASNQHSELIRTTIKNIRREAINKRQNVRYSSLEEWEYAGLSYVMTTSFVNVKNGRVSYEAMSDGAKRNLQVMLDPSIVHAEDSLQMDIGDKASANLLEFDPSVGPGPHDWVNAIDQSLYISWAAVLLYYKGEETQLQKLLLALEVDLQAMWMNIYCLYESMKHRQNQHRMLASQLRGELYSFNRRYNEFLSISGSSLPDFVTSIRKELIATSGIQDYAEKYRSYVEFCIAETDSKDSERQKKYGWINETLLFLIAFFQIAPMLYELMTGGLQEVQVVPVVIMLVLVAAAIVVIVKKN